MLIDIDTWLSQLPLAEAEVTDGLLFVGDLISSTPKEGRISVGEMRLTFSREDILDMEPLAEPKNGCQHPTHRILVRRGARLWEADLRSALPPGRRPFALSVRSPDIAYNQALRFRALEHDFLQRHGLLDV